MDLGQSDLRAKIRKLMVSGALPSEPPSIERPVERLLNRRTRTLIGDRLREPCTICDDEGPQVTYFYIGGRVVRVHAACDAVWQLERAGPE
jgi:hypothetical protein